MTDMIKQTGAAIAYSGSVITTLKQGSKVLNTTHYHNQGLPKLFKELCNVFTGKSSVHTIMPQSIALYSFKSDAHARAALNTDWEALTDDSAQKYGLERISPYIPLSDLETDETTDSIKLQFKIASTQITTGKQIYILALFPVVVDSKAPEKSAIAMYKLLDANKTAWLAQAVITSSTLLVEWQMSFKNAVNEGGSGT